jgi:glycerol kinase
MKSYILVLDHGTTGIKACLMNRDGKIVTQGYEKVRQIYPQPGWVEHDPLALWKLTETVMTAALSQANAGWQDVEAIGITNQRETVILWDKQTGQPIHQAIVWQCRRTADRCDSYKQDTGLVKDIHGRTGLVLDAYFSASKIQWLLEHCPEGKALAERGDLLIGTVDTWILWNLTGRESHATDYTNASRTMLYNIRTKSWDSSLMDLFGVSETALPVVKQSNSLFGTTDPTLTGNVEVPIFSMIGDQQSALYGQKCWTPGSSKNTFGTGAFLMMNLGNECLLSEKGLLTTLACDSEGKPSYALEGAIFIAGAAMEWLKENLGVFQTFDEADALAADLQSNEGVYFVPAFVGLGAPYWQSDARGLFCGLTQGSGKAHFARAGLEAMAYQVEDVVTLMREASQLSLPALKVDGGVSRSNFLMQFLADLMDVPVHRMVDAELTAKGAGYLAGLGCGFWKSSAEIDALEVEVQIFNPNLSREQSACYKSGWQQAIARTLLTSGTVQKALV